MRTSLLRRAVPLSLVAVIAGAWLANAGDLDPPAGPITPTMKTLDEVEPRIAINSDNTPGDADSLFKITQPGSYYLTGNITGVVGKHGIEITASGVTLDLMGFDLAGVPAMGAFDGVSATVNGLTNIAVVNGSVRNWGQDGINLGGVSVSVCRVAAVRASGNVRVGIYAGLNSTVSGCSASGGQWGIYAQDGSTLSDCSAMNASTYGIFTQSGSTLSNCSAYNNTGAGIGTTNGCVFAKCSAVDNTGFGIATSFGCTLTNCSAFSNSTNGILTGNGCTVEGCTAQFNTLDGILCSSACIIRGNTCASNGNGAGNGAGIFATGPDNRIEGNNCTVADRGIDVDAAGNIILKNTCSGNTTNYDIVASNRYGVIVDITAGGTPAVAGNSAASTLTSTDPWANFAY